MTVRTGLKLSAAVSGIAMIVLLIAYFAAPEVVASASADGRVVMKKRRNNALLKSAYVMSFLSVGSALFSVIVPTEPAYSVAPGVPAYVPRAYGA